MKSGILIINKPKDITSRGVVNEVCKKLHTKKVGHTGTLDPLATGVLVLGVNEGTKVIELLTQTEKEYVAEVQLGICTDTLDITGNIIKQEKVDITNEQITEVLSSFLGKQIQEVPIYSAVRVDGKRLYEYARSGEEVALPQREVQIFSIKLEKDLDHCNCFSFRVHVSKGTYIRSLIRDIGIKLGTCATMKNLIRTRQGAFSIDQASPLEKIEENQIYSIDSALSSLEKVEVAEEFVKKIENGQVLPKMFQGQFALIYGPSQRFLAIYQTYPKDSTMMKPYRIFFKEDV